MVVLQPPGSLRSAASTLPHWSRSGVPVSTVSLSPVSTPLPDPLLELEEPPEELEPPELEEPPEEPEPPELDEDDLDELASLGVMEHVDGDLEVFLWTHGEEEGRG